MDPARVSAADSHASATTPRPAERVRASRRRRGKQPPGRLVGTNRAVLVIIQKQAGANVIDTVDRIKAVLPQLATWMPVGHPFEHFQRPHPDHPRVGERRGSFAGRQHRAGGDGDLPFPAPVLADLHRQHHRAAGAGRHVRHHVPAELQPGQPVADGHHHLRRVRGGRRHRGDREHLSLSSSTANADARRRSKARGKSASPWSR